MLKMRPFAVSILAWLLTTAAALTAQAQEAEIRTQVQHGHTSQVVSLAFNPGVTLLASLDLNGTVKIWTLPEGLLLRSWTVGAEGSPYLAFDPPGRLGVIREEAAEWWDPIQGRKVESGAVPPLADSTVRGDEVGQKPICPPGSKFCLRPGRETVAVIEARTSQTVRTVPNPGMFVAAFSPDGAYLAIGEANLQGSGGFLENWRIFLHRLDRETSVSLYEETTNIKDLDISPDGRYLALAEQLCVSGEFPPGRTILFDLKDGHRLWALPADEEGEFFTEVKFSPDSRVLAAETSYTRKVSLWRIPEVRPFRVIDTPDGKFGGGLAISPDGKLLAMASAENSAKGLVSVNYVYRIQDGALAAKLIDPRGAKTPDGFFEYDWLNTSRLVFSPDGKLLAEVCERRDTEDTAWIKIWNLTQRKVTREIKAGPNQGEFGFTPDGQAVILNHTRWPLDYKAEPEKLASPARVVLPRAAVRSGDGRRFVKVGFDGRGLEIWDDQTSQLLATLFNTDQTALVLTPEGFFAGTGDFSRHVHFVRGAAAYEFNRFYDAFYRPDLVEKKLAGQEIAAYQRGLDLKTALDSPPPEVAIPAPQPGPTGQERRVQVKVTARDMGGGVGDIRLYHNGKLVHSRGVYRLAKTENRTAGSEDVGDSTESRYQTVKRDLALYQAGRKEAKPGTNLAPLTQGAGSRDEYYDLDLIRGVNTISVAAFNGQNTVMSAMRSVEVHSDLPAAKPRLFVLAAGIEHFANERFNLALPVKDARDLTAVIQKQSGILFAQVKVELLTDPTKEALLTGARTLAGQMGPQDVFMLFVASHGLAEDDLYYIITANFDGRRASLAQASISSVELMELSKEVPALKQIYILDTCHSGGLGAVVSGLYDARVSVLAQALGMHILAAAQLAQKAADNYQGNGLFTHFVLEALRGAADQNKDHKVNVLELTPFLDRAVRQASSGDQEAYIRNFGDDLALTTVK